MSDKPDINEPRVSATYREVATETAPAHLDRKVLEAARTGARTRYGLARAWMRPLGWAATIALSFAFVLQMTQEDDAAVPTGAADDVVELHEVSGEAIMKAKKLNERAVSQAPARTVPEPAAVPAEDVASATAPGVEPVSCDAAARASAQSWYECIEALREKGLVEAANAELEALRAEFPDFRIPAAN